MTDRVDLDFELPRGVGAPAIARHRVRDLCTGRIEAELVTAAELLVSEIVTNALRHGEGRITLQCSLDGDRLLVEVVDEGSGFERELRRSDIDRVSGWGLGLVEDLSSRWGVHEGTTHVWFELELRGPRLGEPDG